VFVRRCSEFTAVILLAAAYLFPTVQAQTIRVDTTHPVNSFRPTEALGAGVDRIPRAATDKVFAEPILKQILSAGWQTVTYRQNTELYVEAWHWNAKGTWSAPGERGYFVGDANPTDFIRHSYGYPLPHAGFSQPDGRSYSRLTDGDTNTYWKSNPYLTKAYTGEDDSLHPQWVILDLATPQDISAIRMEWADPYAKKYLVQYWTGANPIEKAADGSWVTFPGGNVTDGKGGSATLQLSRAPLPVRWVRVWMTESSNTCDTHGAGDRRNCLGFAIKEIYLGTTSADGRFHDIIRHTKDRAQTNTYCSSVDPWHDSTVVNDRLDQVGFDLFYTSGITRGLPAMIPVAMLYDTPENAAAEIQYIEKRGYPISYIEMGEEPDGKHTLPEDYAALYLQWATALHKIDPKLKLGGPIFEGVNKDIEVWANAEGKTSWMGRFFDYLRSHNRLNDLSFVSFEHYPAEACKLQWTQLFDEANLTRNILQVWRDDGLPPGIPMFISETNIGAESDESFLDIFAALWWADFVGAFFDAGGKAVYYFHYIPLGQSLGCHNTSAATFAMFTMNKDYQIQQPNSQYFAAQLITQEWAQPGSGEHRVYSSASDIVDGAGHVLVTAYALQRPDGDWSLMLVNKDQENAYPVHVSFEGAAKNEMKLFSGQISVVTFGSEQYKWHSDSENPIGGVADPDGPPAHATVNAGPDTVFCLPKASVTIIRGKIATR